MSKRCVAAALDRGKAGREAFDGLLRELALLFVVADSSVNSNKLHGFGISSEALFANFLRE